MKKKLQSVLLIVLLLGMVVPVCAIDFKFGKNKAIIDGIAYQINIKKETATVVKGNEPYIGDIVIPEKITLDSITCYVEEIGAGAFSGSSGMTSIALPSIITKIGAEAFKGCSSITSVTIPAKITEIASGMFED